MKQTIANILFLTHDNWLPHIKKNNREDFERFLKIFLEKNPDAELFLQNMYLEGIKKDKLLLKVGVMNELKSFDSDTFEYSRNRIYSSNKKNEMRKL